MLGWIEKKGSDQGFTLLELLTVLAVITILAALLFTAVTRARQKVNEAVCLNNLRQWGQATHLYAIDHDDWLPRDGSPNGTSLKSGWYIDLPIMLNIPNYHQMPWRTNASALLPRSIWICPANRKRSSGNHLFHYCLNAHVNGSGTGNQIQLSSIPSPATTIWLFDNGKKAAVAQHNNVHTNLHSRGAQFNFLDGHSARFPNTDYWDFDQNQGKKQNPKLRWEPFSVH